MDSNNSKKSNTVSIIALILLFTIFIFAGGVFWLYRIEKLAAKESKNPLITVGLIAPNTSSGSGITAFYDRMKSLYESYESDAKKKSTGSKKSSGGSTSGSTSGDATTGAGGIGESGVLDTDVPWREEGEADLDYSYKEVRACGAAVKGPPTETLGTDEFEQAYQDYLAWIDADCRAAYNEAGKEYPF